MEVKSMEHRGRFRKSVLILLLILLCAALVAGGAEQAKRFTVEVAVVDKASSFPAAFAYDYLFVEQNTQEEHVLTIDVAQGTRLCDGCLVKAAASIELPLTNSAGKGAVYGLSPSGLGFVRIGDAPYLVSTSESGNPATGTPYHHRLRVLTRQLQPKVEVVFQGVDQQPLRLTLAMKSWARDPQGQGNMTHSATRDIVAVPTEGLDLFRLFDSPQDILLFRNFTLAELAWDGNTIAGENEFTLQLDDLPGIQQEITGDARQGFRIVLTASK